MIALAPLRACALARLCIDQNRSIVIRNIRLDVTSFGIPLGIPMIYQHASPGGHMPNIFPNDRPVCMATTSARMQEKTCRVGALNLNFYSQCTDIDTD